MAEMTLVVMSNDVITLGKCYVCLHSRSFPLRADWRKSDSSVDEEPQGIGGGIDGDVVDCLQSAISLKIRLVLISASAIANRDVMLIRAVTLQRKIRDRSQSRDVVASSPSFSRPTPRTPRRACSQAINIVQSTLSKTDTFGTGIMCPS